VNVCRLFAVPREGAWLDASRAGTLAAVMCISSLPEHGFHRSGGFHRKTGCLAIGADLRSRFASGLAS
jgi:hypothetical protein